MQDVKQIIESAGARYLGFTEAPKGNLHQFNDPVTHSTLSIYESDVTDVYAILAKMALHRKKFSEASR